MYDVIVVGGGHAGVEAAAAADRTGAKTALVTLDLSKIGVMSCNPAIGGVGKGHLVKEIDALDGIMPRAIDKACIQFRMLNASKGPAVRGPRAQADRRLYAQAVQKLLRDITNVSLIAGEVSELVLSARSIRGIRLADGSEIHGKSVVITSGTFLGGKTFIGHEVKEQGREGESSCNALSSWFKSNGIPLQRLKTGTPARLDARSVNWSKLEKQPGDVNLKPFSSLTDKIHVPQVPCWITHTNERTHEIVRASIHESSIFNGEIESSGPRYCPSIEDKITRFADKTSHQVFVEPEGLDSHLLYPNGISTSLPRKVQVAYLRSMSGFENVEICQYGYAVEYDYVDPRSLNHCLKLQDFEGLYLAGQINGTTGYEEAAAQGLIAGLAASREARGLVSSIVKLGRDQAYIGVLIDDLVTKGVKEPYRMFTSRAEHRLRLRPDNSDSRLHDYAVSVGCLTNERFDAQSRFLSNLSGSTELVQAISFTPNELEKRNIEAKKDGRYRSLFALAADLRITDSQLDELDVSWAKLPLDIKEHIRNDALYFGYEDRSKSEIKALEKSSSIKLPVDLDYSQFKFLSAEECEILTKHKPQSLGVCRTLRGVTPASIVSLAKSIEFSTRG